MLHGAQTVYVPNGTALRARVSPSSVGRWGLQPANYILFLGRFSPEKNCRLLIEAYEKLDTTAKLVLAGGSSYTDAYGKELRLHSSDQISFLDWVSGRDLEDLLTNAMLFVLPSDLEGMSLALLDAMGAGVCVLASDIPENRELVEGAGFTFKRGDSDDLTRMLQLLVSNGALRRAAAEKAQERIRTGYLWSSVAAQIGATYQTLMGNRVDSPASIAAPAAVPQPAPNKTAA